MRVLKTVQEGRDFAEGLRRQGKKVGLVPTMGALHDGHYSLVRESVRQCEHTIATIFVNPMQFAPGEDLDQYPRTLEADLKGLRDNSASAVFLPKPEEIYPPGFSTMVRPPKIAETLESASRPTHFEGVATVVLKLFQILPVSHAFFGQKDFQQFRVIEAMVRDLNVDVRVVGCPIVRESDGLAMSSRNRYLDPAGRVRARKLSAALSQAQAAFDAGERSASTLEQILRDVLISGGKGTEVDAVDYACVVDSLTLQPVVTIKVPAVALVAARVGSTRLIDNQILTDEIDR